MKQTLCLALLCLLCISTVKSQNDYARVWEALNKSNHFQANSIMETAIKNKTASPDLFITYLLLQAYNGKDKDVDNFETEFYNKAENPYPYVYALWFNNAVLGDYGKKTATQLHLLEKLMTDGKAHGSLVAASHYQKGHHLVRTKKFADAVAEHGRIGSVANWQYVGPFENLSRSGFYKNYGPLAHPEPDAQFASITNAKIKWFTPARECGDGWTPFCYQINRQTATAYAQTFVEAKDEQDVLCNIGATGAIKVWINDALVLSEYKERVTEMDAYTVKCHLNKGNNRVLVQLSYTSTSFPNFMLRFTDDKYVSLPGLAGSNVYKPYTTATVKQPELIPHFAETFFINKIAADSNNLVNYVMLSNVYMRNKKTLEARHIIEAAMQKEPGNSVLREKLIEVLIEEENRSLMLEEVEKLKKADPESFIAMELDIKNDISNEKYEDAAKKIARREAIYGEDESSLTQRLSLLVHEKKYEELVSMVEKSYKKYPEMESLIPIMYSLKREVYKDNKAALKVYENYLKDNHSYNIISKYADALQELGYADKALDLKLTLAKNFPYDPTMFSSVARYYYGAQQYEKADQFVKKALELSPYSEYYQELQGDIKSEMQQKQEAFVAYQLSLQYDPNQYDVINKQRKLDGKPESFTLFTEGKVEDIIKNDKPSEAKNTDYGYYIMHDEKNVIVHPGGATEEYSLYMIKITNEKGISQYKESSIGASRHQELLIEKAEIVKPSGAIVKGERNENEIVFTNLEVGDVLVFKYRLQSYVYGHFAHDYWSTYAFGGKIYKAFTRYNILMPAKQTLHYTMINSTLQPEISNVENFKQYTWVLKAPAPLEDEPLMPVSSDLAPVLHLSTLHSWNNIASWYQDLTTTTTEEDYEITSLFKTLLPAEKRSKLSQFKQAQIIYNYIEKNIRYSSVSFRQSAFVPQRASITLNTRLGDCKDLSNLFVTLCRMAGIESRMVLVDTRNNGEKDMMLPSIGFNHCIAKVKLDNKDYYVELTDNYLPFASLPNSLPGAQILEIPAGKTVDSADLKYLTTPNRTKEVLRRTIELKPDGADMQVTVKAAMYGHLSSGVRENYLNLDSEKQRIEIEKAVVSDYKNNVKVANVQFQQLDQLSDSATYQYSYKVKDEIAEIGSMQTFRITYPDKVATLNYLTSDTRLYPVDYRNYEDADTYETTVIVTAPQGKTIIELPNSENLSFKGMTYTLTYKLASPSKLVVKRTFNSERKTIAAEDYSAFKTFFEKIVKAEQKMIAFK
ncbi:tetratricopeptide (TPR) repeat protein [Filimonas zeae]|uniref:transglutaminase domain-containing protein n=1 Tax=Filimonas zeae TaxID=1737353 RepID=UPI00166BBC9F|nr:transglutaminase domain-containing protein [Filimonas zeae]MDR6337566.1 tetratricopeptide (TPR) repeat protein [Filimonas zeae]